MNDTNFWFLNSTNYFVIHGFKYIFVAFENQWSTCAPYTAARRESEPNSASSQFFFLLKESELTPSGTNILDGRYAVFGYVVEGQELLRELKVRSEGGREKKKR